MKNLILTLTLVTLVSTAFGQYDRRQFLDENMEVVSGENDASYYRTYMEDPGVGYHVKVYYLDGKIRMTGTYRDMEMLVPHGHFVYYFHQGHIESEGYCRDGYKQGPWKRWDYEGNRKPDRIYSGRTPDEITESIESRPAKYPGGYAALSRYIRENLNYPEEAKEQGIQGEPSVAFNIDEEGFVKNVVIYESANYYLDKEALRLVFAMPQWEPAKRNGEPVESKFILPLTFRIPDSSASDQ